MKINITRNGKTFSIESEDAAGVPDVTQNAGPDIMKLADDAQKPASDDESEFDSNAAPAVQTKAEADDKTESVEEKASEAYGIAALLKKTNPKVLAKVKSILLSEESADKTCEEDSTTVTTTTETPAEEPAAPEAPAEEGVGEVTQADGSTVIEANGLTITIENDDSAAPADTPAEEPAAPEAPAPVDTPAEEPAKSEDCGDPAQNSIESFFANLNLNDL